MNTSEIEKQELELEELEAMEKALNAKQQVITEKLQAIAKKKEVLAQESKNSEIAKNKKVIEFIRKNREFILGQMKHSCSSCKENGETVNGYNSDVGYARCTKCFLIEMLDVDYYSELFKVEFDFNIRPIV